MKRGILVFSLTLIFLSQLVQGQTYSCSQLDSLLTRKSHSQATQFIFNNLAQKPTQKRCFYEKSILLFKGKSDNGSLDSVKHICSIWETVSQDPCLAVEAYTHFLAEQYTTKNKETFCKAAHEAFNRCPKSPPSVRTKQLAILCPEFTCAELDSLLYQDTSFRTLSEAKKMQSLLAQRGCTQNKTYQKVSSMVVENEPSFNGLYHMAEKEREMGQWKEAYHHFAKAEKKARSKQEQSLCYLGIAKTLELEKNWKGAKDFVTMSVEADPENPESFVFLAQLLQIAEKECALGSKEEKCALYLLIAQAYEKGKHATEAKLFYQKSNLENPLKEPNTSLTIKLGCFIDEEVVVKK